ncbi:MAG: YARHG domain-containing protein [Myxococcota bacterium]
MCRALVPLTVIAALLALASPALANDGIYGGSGSLPMPLTSTEVAMIEEHVVLRWDAKHRAWNVTCDFVFENTSAEPVSLTIGFPFPVVDPDAGDTSAPDGQPQPEAGRPLVWKFRTQVDGRAVRAREARTITNPALPDVSYDFAYLWDMTFPPGRRVKVRNSYQHGISAVADGTQWAAYALKTGTLWKGGRIGRSRIEVITQGPRLAVCPAEMGGLQTQILPAGATVRTTAREIEVAWDLTDFEPRDDLSVCFVDLDAVAQMSFWELEQADLSTMSREELRLLRNRIYAARGYVFRDADLAAHFAKQWWYRPDPKFKARKLQPEERALVARIKAAEKALQSAPRAGRPGAKP